VLPLALLVTAGGGAAQQGDATRPHVALNLPVGQAFVVEHRDQRQLPGGALATFHQQLRLSFAGAADGIVATYQPQSHRCDGPAAICAAFTRQAAMRPSIAARFHIDGQGAVTPLDASGPAATAVDDTTAQVASAVTAHEAAAPGAVMAADLRLLIRFANLALPANGQRIAVVEGRLFVAAMTAATLDVQIDRADTAADPAALHGRVECRVTRATGLVERCRFTDWMGNSADRPIRVRDVIVTQISGPVS
jgi:hypothetical protein